MFVGTVGLRDTEGQEDITQELRGKTGHVDVVVIKTVKSKVKLKKWIWKVCMETKSGHVPDKWMKAVIFPL